MKINSLDDTKKLAEKIASLVKIGDVITLKGDLGAGKTTFARYFINSLLSEEQEITSPTFNIAHQYDAPDFDIWHFDLYRLKNEREAEEIGLYDAFDEAVSLIEWPEIIGDILPEDRLLVELSLLEDERQVVLRGYGEWEERLMKIGKHDE